MNATVRYTFLTETVLSGKSLDIVTFSENEQFNSSGNWSGNTTWEEYWPEMCCIPGIERILVPVIFTLIVLAGCVGNILVLLVVLKNKDQFRNTTNLFIVNLAIADMLYLLFCAPFHSIIYTMPSWPFGEFMCKFVHLIQYSSMIASVLTLVAMAADRFLAVGYPLLTKHIRTPCVALFLSVIIWIVSLAMATPWPVFYTVRIYHKYGSISVCADDWGSSGNHRPTYFLILFLFSYVIPLAAILILSTLMVRQLWVMRGPEGTSVGTTIEAKKKVTKLIIVVVLVFCLCWLPTHVIWIWTNFSPETWMPTYPFYYMRIIAHVLSYANSSMNPVIYAFLSSQFRKGFHRALHCADERTYPARSVYSMTHSNEGARPPSTAHTSV